MRDLVSLLEARKMPDPLPGFGGSSAALKKLNAAFDDLGHDEADVVGSDGYKYRFTRNGPGSWELAKNDGRAFLGFKNNKFRSYEDARNELHYLAGGIHEFIRSEKRKFGFA